MKKQKSKVVWTKVDDRDPFDEAFQCQSCGEYVSINKRYIIGDKIYCEKCGLEIQNDLLERGREVSKLAQNIV